MYINVFSKQNFQEAGIEVVNIPVDTLQKPLLYSTGIHPWYINKQNYNTLVEQFFITASEKQCIAIGECGLDSTFTSNYFEQEKIFVQQIKTANLLKKPLIIYCFKSWDKILEILQKQKNKMPLIILDDYLPENIDVLSPVKEYYIAFNKSVFLKDTKSIYWIKNITSKKILFYNTDEDISIKDIYQAASDILNIETHTLEHQILENFYKAFMIDKLPI